jgi:hypothetical protein
MFNGTASAIGPSSPLIHQDFAWRQAKNVLASHPEK